MFSQTVLCSLQRLISFMLKNTLLLLDSNSFSRSYNSLISLYFLADSLISGLMLKGQNILVMKQSFYGENKIVFVT